jgi:hypothetical protein
LVGAIPAFKFSKRCKNSLNNLAANTNATEYYSRRAKHYNILSTIIWSIQLAFVIVRIIVRLAASKDWQPQKDNQIQLFMD